jgi:hypothetical protein
LKIGILSFHDSRNYGAILQIYALKRTLEKLQVDVSVVDYSAIESEYGFSFKAEIKAKGVPLALIKYLYYCIFVRKTMNFKKDKFKKFINKNFNLSKRYNSIDEFVCDNSYDVLICGSDQIWNPEITKGFDRMMFCDFPSNTIKRYSYAASVGDVKIIDTEENKAEFFRLLKNFDGIAVRENELADFISLNSDRKPEITLDPTLLLDETEYIAITDTEVPKDKYVLLYQLARYSRATEVAALLAKEKNLKIIEIINNPYIYNRKKSMLFSASPSQFLHLIKNAEYVITNSFHGTIFSIIFKKNFYTIASRTRNSRIANLMNTLELQDRLLKENDDDFTRDAIDYDKVDIILAEEREKSINYLRDIVKRKDNE